MKHQALFYSKAKSKKISVVCCKFLFGPLRVKYWDDHDSANSVDQNHTAPGKLFNLLTTLKTLKYFICQGLINLTLL